MTPTRVAPLLLVIAGCVPQAQSGGVAPDQPPVSQSPATEVGKLPGLPPPPLMAPQIEGQFEQGGWIRGVAPYGAVSATHDGEALALDPVDRTFLIGIDRDAAATTEIIFTDQVGQTRSQVIAIKPRAWQIERIDAARTPGGATAAFMKIRQPELDAIWAARQKQTGAQGWRQDFIWPVTGRISGRFGSQRIYRGEPGSYHSGIDISTGTSGTPYVAPADGVVVLAVAGYSLEGNLLIIDHGHGLNSAFLHSARLHVKTGDAVKQGQHIGDIGMSGRATGPHLHWSLKWHEARLDPLLFTGPMS